MNDNNNPFQKSKQPFGDNMIRCKNCGQELISLFRHDFKRCSCPNQTFIDGGSDYLRIGGNNLDDIEIWDKNQNKWIFIRG